MMEIGESCKLCLKYVQGTNMAVLDETILGKLEFLQMDLDQSVEDSNSVCKECEERIEKAFDFKSCLVNTESCLVPYVCEDKTQKVNLKVVIEKDNSSMSIGETSTEKEVCRLCKNFVDAIAVISLPKILKDDNVTEVFQGHIPEMDLEVTENPVVCERCQKSLASFSTLVASWSIANGMNEMEGDEDEDVKGEFEPNFEMVKVKNETIDDFSDSNTTSSTSMLEISDSAKTVKKTKKGKSTTVKTEPDSSDIVSAMNREIKTEDGEEDESLEEDLQLKSEEVEIKDEDGFEIRTRETAAEVCTVRKNPRFHENYSISKLQKSELEHHHLHLTGIEEITRGKQSTNAINNDGIFKCGLCSYATKSKYNLQKHDLIHRNLSVVNVFKCADCSFISKHKTSLSKHVLLHKSFSDVLSFKCPNCSYVTKCSSNFKRHLQTHDNSSDIKTYKCPDCDYVTKQKSNLKGHVLVHKSFKEVETFKCTECTYITKRKSNLDQHIITHKSLGKVERYNCLVCSYSGRNTFHLEQHVLLHEKQSQVQTYRCEYCSYETKWKTSIKQHVLTHNGFKEDSKNAPSLNEHVLTHPSVNKVDIFKCADCSFVTKRKSYIRQHTLIHKRLGDCNRFKCGECDYIATRKSDLRKHGLVHKASGETKTFSCVNCSFVTKRKWTLTRHMKSHKK